MRVDEFDFELPEERIAQQPPAARGDSRLMVLDRGTGERQDTEFRRLVEWLRPGDLLVRNDTRVLRARLRGTRPGGGRVEVLLLERRSDDGAGEVWECLAKPGARLRRHEMAALAGGIGATWLDDASDTGIRTVRLTAERPIEDLLETFGEVPLPPYIERAPTEADAEAYQTVYAAKPGSVAAPTAGLHFTPELLAGLEERGVRIASLTLHVGASTFLPIRSELVEDHRLGTERIEIPAATADAVRATRGEGRRVVAVGTTTVRALEGAADRLECGTVDGSVSLFILPGYRFRVVDAMITNFHLPRSTLLMLVASFAGKDLVLAAYREALALGYRFYSYGDAMLIV